MSDLTPNEREIISRFSKLMKKMNIVIILFIIVSIWIIAGGFDLFVKNDEKLKPTTEKENNTDSNIIDEETGLIIDTNVELVKVNCTSCHSASLIIYTSVDSTQWHDIIKWMQKTQGLWDLGSNEKPIIEYLSKNYGISHSQNQPDEFINTWYEID